MLKAGTVFLMSQLGHGNFLQSQKVPGTREKARPRVTCRAAVVAGSTIVHCGGTLGLEQLEVVFPSLDARTASGSAVLFNRSDVDFLQTDLVKIDAMDENALLFEVKSWDQGIIGHSNTPFP